MPRREMHSSRTAGPFEQRQLSDLHADHAAFIQSHGGDKKEAARYNNCLHKPLLDIPLDHVAPPYLHILLGVVLKHHKLLEEAAHKIDLKIVNDRDETLTDLGKSVKQYGSQWKVLKETQEKLVHLRSCLVFCEHADDTAKYRKKLEETEYILSSVTYQDLTLRTGPVASSLDSILSHHRITPQAYHSRSFIGNHCHKYLVSKVFQLLTEESVSQTRACTLNPFITDEAHQVQLIFNSLNQAFCDVHQAVSHTRPVTLGELPSIKASIDNYMTLYRRCFPNKTIPKQHILEHHCISWMEKHKFGLGLLGEQGTEASHQQIAKLEKRACGINNVTKKLEFILKTQLLQVAPVLQSTDST
ncbi:uncharacterized protein LOC106013308 [Aplysia californica]|uniref:Uncharacterized protein LOC106013308 n=1 Tax=Aplysia californica TaxID=6500 RepID=A0ABM1AAR8_APLCA|nr:uncharacterized protein LOC106013308 [Aplysia californica]